MVLLNHFHKKLWGSEFWIVNCDLYCGKILSLEPNWVISYHYHKLKHETFYILEGMVYFKYKEKEFKMPKGTTIVIPRETPHTFSGLTTFPSQILEISTTHYEDDSYREDTSHKINHEEFTRLCNLPLYNPNMIE